jgi:DNA-binding transcriptional LysR family regulator
VDLLAQMTTFVRIVDSGSLSAAARRLRRSLPAVSRQLRALEEELGAPLVLRTTRKLTVTDFGRAYYERCARILREVEEAQASGRSSGAEGRLVVSASVTFGTLRVAPTLPALLAAHPRLRLDLRLEDRLSDLVGDGVDVAVRAGALLAADSPGLIAAPLPSFPRVVVAAPAYLRRRGEPKDPAALARHDALVQVSGAGAPVDQWRFLAADGREESVQVRELLTCNALAVLRDAAIAGLGAARLPTWLVADALAAGALRPLLPRWTCPPAQLLALYRVELRGAARVRVFVEHLRRSLTPA